jgi:hypothetical protein
LTDGGDCGYIDTLAAACAENGEFESAIKWQTRALELKPGDAEFQKCGKERLELYKSGRPYTEELKK